MVQAGLARRLVLDLHQLLPRVSGDVSVDVGLELIAESGVPVAV